MKKYVIFVLVGMVFIIFATKSFSENTNHALDNQLPMTQDSSTNISPIAENPDLENQINGEYPPLKREESPPLGAIQHAWDNAEPDAGIYWVNFNPRETIRLVVREFMTTAVVFPRWENIEDVIVGDQSNYQIIRPKNKDNVVIIRPMGFVGLDTSITMLGESGHTYTFYVRTEGYNSHNISDISVHIRVPAPPFLADSRKSRIGKTAHKSSVFLDEQTDYLEAVIFDPADLDFNFSMSCDRSIAPERVYSDGVRTWFDYGKRMGSKSLPTIYIVLDGIETPVNVSREKTRLVAQAGGSFALRSGEKRTCVYPTEDKDRT